MTSTISIIETQNGETLTTGLQSHNWRAIATEIAAERGEDVLVHGADDEDGGYSVLTAAGEWRALTDAERAALDLDSDDDAE